MKEDSPPMRISVGKLLMIVASLMIAGAASAQEEFPANWHQVEVIIFAQSDMHGVEKSPVEPVLSYPSRLRILAAAEQLRPVLSADASQDERLAALMVPDRFLSRDTARTPAAFVPLPSEMRQLNGDAAALQRNSAYRILFHDAWQQPIDSASQTDWVFVRGGNVTGEHSELEGALRFSHARFYHVDTNLWLSRFEATLTNLEEETRGTLPNASTILPAVPATPKSPQLRQIEALSAPTSFNDTAQEVFGTTPRLIPAVAQIDVLKSSQQVQHNQLHYIDHPRMGVLVLITPLYDDGVDASEEIVD